MKPGSRSPGESVAGYLAVHPSGLQAAAIPGLVNVYSLRTGKWPSRNSGSTH